MFSSGQSFPLRTALIIMAYAQRIRHEGDPSRSIAVKVKERDLAEFRGAGSLQQHSASVCFSGILL